MSLRELFCSIDDYWQVYEAIWYQSLLESRQTQRRRACRMSMSEMMTIVMYFYQKQYLNFKTCSAYKKRISEFTQLQSLDPIDALRLPGNMQKLPI